MSTTAKYKLPLISGNMTADVVRDMNALATKTDEVIATLASASANKTKFEEHVDGFMTEEGVHNQRYFNGKYEIKIGDTWKPVAALMDSTPPNVVTNIAITPSNQKFTLTWTNPTDDDFEKVKIVMKEGSEVTSVTDGEVIHDAAGTSVEKTGLKNNVTYHVRFFVYDIAGNVNSTVSMKASVMPSNASGVTGANVMQNATGTQFTLTWTNPTAQTHQKTIVYASETDLTNKTREQCIAESTTIKQIFSAKGTAVNHTTTPKKTYYFKIFAEHLISGQTQYDGGVVTSLLAKDTQPPTQITNFKAVPKDKSITLTWANPKDADFEKVIIRYKTGSYPTSETDGQSAYDGNATTATISSLQNGTAYFFRAFTRDTNGNINKTATQLTATPEESVLYTIRINKAVSDPAQAVEYIGTQHTPATYTDKINWGSWKDKFPFNQIKPCLFKGGKRVKYLNPDNFTQDAEGQPAKLDGSEGDVMIEIPKVYWKINSTGSYIDINVSSSKLDESYKCLAHMRGNVEKDFVYIGAFLGYNGSIGGSGVTNQLHSISGVKPVNGKNLSECRRLAQLKGGGYALFGFYQVTLLQILFVLLFKTLDSRSALGHGDVNSGWDEGRPSTTGGQNEKGIFYGDAFGLHQMRFLGIEDLWGNYHQWLDGIVTDTINVKVGTDVSNDIGDGFTAYDDYPVDGHGYVSDIAGTTELGFFPKAYSGSQTTYYCDMAIVDPSSAAIYGSHSASNPNTTSSSDGLFSLSINQNSESSSASISARLIYL